MKQEIRHRLAWLALAFAVLVVVLMMSGCAMFEEQIATMQASLGFAGDKEIITCTSNTETGCEGWVASETTTTE
jgi:hypothetical protein